jgi:hypothetical protein
MSDLKRRELFERKETILKLLLDEVLQGLKLLGLTSEAPYKLVGFIADLADNDQGAKFGKALMEKMIHYDPVQGTEHCTTMRDPREPSLLRGYVYGSYDSVIRPFSPGIADQLGSRKQGELPVVVFAGDGASLFSLRHDAVKYVPVVELIP